MQEPCDRNIALLEFLGNRGPGIERPHPINEHAHFYSSFHGALQCVRKHHTRAVVVEDVRAQRHRVLRAVDRIQHGGIGSVTVHQQPHVVSRRYRDTGNTVDQAAERGEVCILRGEYLLDAVALHLQLGGIGLESQAFLPQFCRQPPDPVDTEQDIQHCAGNREHHHHADPPNRRACIPLIQHDMSRCPQCQQHGQRTYGIGPHIE